MNIKKTAFSTLIAVLVISSMVATPAVAAGGLAWSGDSKAPNPAISADVTVDEWDGEEFDNALQYYDDSGEAASLPASVNESNDNPITVTATDIDFDQRDEFPRTDGEENNSASALDASEWTVSGATVSETTTAPSTDALNYAGTGTSDSATYGNFSNADAEKGYITLAADVTSASGTPTLQVNDSDGDYVEVELYNSSADEDTETVLANSTGEGQVLQVQIGDLAVQGTGDGTMDSAEEVQINGDIDADFSVIDTERTRELQFGERLVENDDDELETVEVVQPNGAYTVANMDGFDETMSDATIYGVTVDAVFQASDLQDDEDASASFESDNDYPNWDQVANIDFKLELPTAFDLSYANTELVDEPALPDGRYQTVEVAEDVGDTDFEDIDSWSSVTSSYDGAEEVTLDSTVSSGTEYAISYKLTLTDGEVSAMQMTSGGGAGPMATSGGGPIDFLTSLPGIIFGGIVSFLGLKRFGVV